MSQIPPKTPIFNPASYVAPVAIGFSDPDGNFLPAGAADPLPVVFATQSAAPDALSGETAASAIVGPFVPVPDRPIHLSLAGEWSGVVALQRSVDGGASRQGLTAGGEPWARYSGNANEAVWQESESGASLWLDIQLTSGVLAYRVSQ